MFKPYKEQLIVIDSTADRILLIAGAGTGKTTVLSCKAIKHGLKLIENQPTWADKDAKVLLISLTNYAADNAKLAIKTLVRDNLVNDEIGIIDDKQAVVDRIRCCTIHSFAFQQLLRYSKAKGFNGFIVDNECEEEILDNILENTKLPYKDNPSIKKDLLKINALYIKNGKDIRSVIQNKYPEYTHHTRTFINVLKTLEQTKHKESIITYDDMGYQFYILLKNEGIREQIIRKHPIVIVDEFQDTGLLQWNIIKKLIGAKSKLLCAGDDGQTIFTWAGASFYRFKHFEKHYPDCEKASLVTNRRSTKHIVALSNDLIAQSVYATNKYLSAEANGPRVRIRNYPDQRKRNEYIITEIERLIKEELSYDQIAIIYRFYQDLLDLKEVLTKSGIPFKVFGDKSKRDRPIILVIFALINIIESSRIGDNEWRTMITFLKGVGNKRVDQIVKWLKEKKPEETVYPKPYRFTESLQELLQFIYKLKKSTASNAERLVKIIEYARILPNVNSSIKEHIRPTLLQLAHKCDSLSEILNKYFDRSYPLCYPVNDEPPYADSYVTLSTIHRIKGGGFHTVFYLGTQDHLYEKYGLFKSQIKKEGELQLMNVAVTRARRELHLLFPIDMHTWRNNKDASNPWRFVRNAYYVPWP